MSNDSALCLAVLQKAADLVDTSTDADDVVAYLAACLETLLSLTSDDEVTEAAHAYVIRCLSLYARLTPFV